MTESNQERWSTRHSPTHHTSLKVFFITSLEGYLGWVGGTSFDSANCLLSVMIGHHSKVVRVVVNSC